MGVTNRLRPTDVTSVCKTSSDPEDTPDSLGLANIDHFAQFIRGTPAPPRDTVLTATSDAQAGSQLFGQIGCGICHVSSLVTAPAGTVINGGSYTVPDAIGNKVFHQNCRLLVFPAETSDLSVPRAFQDWDHERLSMDQPVGLRRLTRSDREQGLIGHRLDKSVAERV